MQVTVPQTTITVPGPAALLRFWKWALLAVLVLVFGLVGGGGAALATGNSITTPDTAGLSGSWTSLALDASGYPVVSHYDNGNGDLRIVHCNDANCAGGDESLTSPDIPGDVGSQTSLALDATGNPVVSYYDATNDDLRLLHCGNANCTAGNSKTSPDTTGDVGQYTSLALDASGNPVVSYYDNGNSDLKVIHCNDANCAGGDESVTSPDTLGSVGQYTSLALDSSGNPVVSYNDISNYDLKVLHCNDANCTGGDDSTVPVGQGGLFTSLALDVSGRPVVSYYDGVLNIAHCSDANCTGATISSPDTPGLVGEYTSLQLDASGNPVVSYFAQTNAGLRLLHCNDPFCASGGDSITSPDPVATEGQYTSLQLDVLGNPVVSYLSFTNGDLKVLHCTNANCSANVKAGINIVNVGEYALPKSCFEVRNSSQTPLFQVCDNDFAGAPDTDAVCVPDGICNDDNPTQGSINVNVTPGDYRVVETQAAPQHTAVTGKQTCDATVGSCGATFTNVPKIRPWHPWDITGGPGNTPDGVVRVQDILDVVLHYFDDKPLN